MNALFRFSRFLGKSKSSRDTGQNTSKCFVLLLLKVFGLQDPFDMIDVKSRPTVPFWVQKCTVSKLKHQFDKWHLFYATTREGWQFMSLGFPNPGFRNLRISHRKPRNHEIERCFFEAPLFQQKIGMLAFQEEPTTTTRQSRTDASFFCVILPQKESGKRSAAKGVQQKSDEKSDRSVRKSDQKRNPQRKENLGGRFGYSLFFSPRAGGRGSEASGGGGGGC